MRPVYWIEDELDLLGGTREELNDAGCTVREFRRASEFLSELRQLELDPGPIVLDLWLPAEEIDGVDEVLQGPRVGLWLLGELRQRLGADWTVFIVSGNLTVDVMEKLTSVYGVPRERIFSKPLNEQNADLVSRVLAAAR
jgi:FixJ family two-component response regulator